ncbi:hypothetical protein FGF1_34950 [Flavobacteriaceae bacterium GF1]
MGKYINTVITILVGQWVFSQITMPPVGQTDYNVLSGQTVTLSDLQSITLRPNTFIQSGAIFTATVLPSTAHEPYTDIALSGTENYVFTRSFQRAMPTFTTSGTKEGDVYEAITYFDGLGRPLQQVDIKAARDRDDIITHMEYDGYGRQEKEWLPYHEPTGALGSYRGDRASATQGYYKTNYAEDFTTLSTPNVNAHTQKEFEPSPLNRVLKQAAPGQDWKLGNGHEIGFGYHVNSQSNDAVAKFEVVFTGGNPEAPTLNKLSGAYATGELYKNVTYDENHTSGTNHSTEEFVDKNGRVILKRTYNNGPHDTYYVYDDYGNLTYVIPPKVTTASVSTTELNELCYQYKYDHRNRLVEKKLPGKGTSSIWEEIVYNKLDQPVLTRDPVLYNTARWLFTKYDAHGRVAYSGIHLRGTGRTSMQASVDASLTYEGQTDATTSVLLDNKQVHYTNNTYPSTDIVELHTINYYDSYVDTDGLSVPTTVLGQAKASNVKGLPTVSKVRVLGTSYWITTITGYDEKGRAIYTATKNNYLNTTDIVETELDFGGKVVQTRATHQRTGHSDIVTLDTFTYDHQGRLARQQQTINGQAQETLVDNSYNHLGQLVQKEVGGGLQTVEYAYNVRGWLKQINDPTSLGGDLFAFAINYNDPSNSAKARYDRAVTEGIWKTANDNVQRSYLYDYDAFGRITGATSSNTNYNLGLVQYDKMGNITRLKRNGHRDVNATNFGLMDDLTYQYDGNQLKSINDATAASTVTGFIEGAESTTEYQFDANGNMTRDDNKKITSVKYNHLNMPTKITVTGSNAGILDYVYAADRTKLQKKKTQGGVTTTTDYNGNYVYENGTLKQITQPEGYIEPDGSGWQYVYRYVDIWGNTRITYADDNNDGSIDPSTEIRKEQNYYPFGMEHKGYNFASYGVENNLKTYQGQELTKDLGLNTHEWRYRVSDPSTGRFWQIDPLAEDYVYNSTYAFQENKLGMGTELEGLELDEFDWNQLTEQGIMNGTALGEDYNPDNPNHENMIYPGPPGKAQKVIKGVQGMAMGTVGAVGSVAVIAESGGTASLLGGTTALTLSITEIGIGFGQIVDAFANDGANEPLHKSSSLAGLVAHQNGSENAEMIDALGQFAPGMLSGGNLSTIAKMSDVTLFNTIQGVDAIQDTYGVIEAAGNLISTQSSSNNTSDNSHSSSTSSLKLDTRLVKTEKNPF